MTKTKKEKILILEGEAGYAKRIEEKLKEGGYNVEVVKNGVDGLKAIIDNMPHLVLLDISMPGEDGYEIIAKKQAEPLLAKIPIFLMSSLGVPINMAKIPNGSVTEFIMALHADPSEILVKIDRHFGYGEESLTNKEEGKESTSGGKEKKIVWVEDDKLIGTILSKKLLSSGFDLFHAKNGEEALNSLKVMIPDAIVLDLILPGMSGFDILKSIREDERMKNVPVVILSNLSKPSDFEKAKALGAQKFLVKAATSLDEVVSELKLLCK